MSVLRALGHPYSDAEIENAERDALAEADRIAGKLRAEGIALEGAAARSEAIAVIAYLQTLGRAWQEAQAAGAGGR
jgi:cbb3-type cytochrome oxidase cytochrome c subunit